MGAISRYPVSDTVRARNAARLQRIRLPGLRMLRAAAPEFRRAIDERYRERTLGLHLRRVGILADLGEAELTALRAKAELLSFRPGETIVREGTPATSFFLVRGGYVKLSVEVAGSDLAVTYLRAGDFAGESALVLDERWPFTLQAVENVELVKLDQEDFATVLSRFPELHARLWRESLARLKARGKASRDPVASEYLQMAIESGLIHGESVLLIDLATCTRCDDCVRACADTHGGRAVFVREGERYRNWLIPTSCYQCTDPVCMMDCPTGAITRAVGTLEVTVDASTCIGCSNCAKNCPWGNIIMVETGETRSDGRPEEVSSKCDLCAGRPHGPACVRSCPHGSAVRVSFKDLDRVRAALR
jgi:Fe-S-cluster-containing hydrogenase component 2/CRP-like cAMP-binding protein